jgi:hypothetical protein
MPFELWLMFVAVSLLPAISPGPAVMLAISNTLRFGRNATLASATGNMMGLIVIGYAVAFGFGALMAASAVAFTVLKIIGASLSGLHRHQDPARRVQLSGSGRRSHAAQKPDEAVRLRRFLSPSLTLRQYW